MIYFLGRPGWCASNISVDGRPATAADIGQPSEPLGPILGNQIQATFGFDNALPAYFSTRKNELGDVGRWGLDIYGTKGIVKIRMNAFPEISWFKTPSWTVSKTRTWWQPLPFSEPLVSDDPSATMNQFVIDDLLRAIEQDREPGVSLQSGRDSYELTQAVVAAHIHGGRIDLPLVDRRHPLAEWNDRMVTP